MKENLTKATTGEWYASIFGACFIAFALGVLLAGYFSSFSLLIMIIGVGVHSWGMYHIHQRNK
jgi:hypothetical protein